MRSIRDIYYLMTINCILACGIIIKGTSNLPVTKSCNNHCYFAAGYQVKQR